MRALALLLSLLLCPALVWADETSATPTAAPSVTPSLELPASVALAAGDPAPFAGVLLTEARLDLVIAGRVELAECKGNLDASERVRVSLAEDVAEATTRVATAPSSSNSVWTWVVVGFAVGVIASGAAIWGAANLLEAGK